MDFLIGIGFFVVIALVWRGLVQKMRGRGRGAFSRHLLGSVAGIAAGFLFFAAALESGIITAKKTESQQVTGRMRRFSR